MKKYFTLALSLMVMCMFIACGGEKKVEEKPAVETETQLATSGMGGYTVTDVTNGGTITGKVTFAGMIPQKKKLEVTKDMNVCGKTEHYDESVVVSSDK